MKTVITIGFGLFLSLALAGCGGGDGVSIVPKNGIQAATGNVSTPISVSAPASGSSNGGTGNGGGGEGLSGGGTSATIGAPVINGLTVGVLLLGTTGTTLEIGSTAALQVKNGIVIVDSADNSSVEIAGSGTLLAPTLYLAGGAQTFGKGTIQATEVKLAAAVADPLAKVAEPDPTQMTVQSTTSLVITTATTLKPGVYVGGIQVTGKGNVTLQSGVYYLEGGGLVVTGGAQIAGTGVLLFNAPIAATDLIDMTGASVITLSAATTGIYQNLVMFQKRGTTETVLITGGSNTKLTGGIYAPSAPLAIVGKGDCATGGSFQIASSLELAGSGNFSVGH